MQRYELVRGDVTTRYWVGGRTTGPVVVFLHGATLVDRAWDTQVEAWGPTTAWRSDLRGTATSDRPWIPESADAVVAPLDESIPAPVSSPESWAASPLGRSPPPARGAA